MKSFKVLLGSHGQGTGKTVTAIYMNLFVLLDRSMGFNVYQNIRLCIF